MKTPSFGAVAIGLQNPKSTDQRGHLRCVERQQLGPIYEQLFGRDVEGLLLIVAEPVNVWAPTHQKTPHPSALEWHRRARV